MIHDWLARRPRFHLHFTPTSASWINQVERWFAALTEQQIRRGTHRSTTELEEAIEEYLTVYNEDPKPFTCLIAARARSAGPEGCTHTVPGSVLNHQIPMRTFADRDEREPGFFEIDLVAHDGGDASGACGGRETSAGSISNRKDARATATSYPIALTAKRSV